MPNVDSYVPAVFPSPTDQVAVKVPRVVHDPLEELRAEAEQHAKTWMELEHVLLPFGFLSAHGETGTPAALVTEIAMRVGQPGMATALPLM